MNAEATLAVLEASLLEPAHKYKWSLIFRRISAVAEAAVLHNERVPNCYLLWLRNGVAVSIAMNTSTDPDVVDGYNKLLWTIAAGFYVEGISSVGIADYRETNNADMSDYDTEIAKTRAKPDGEALAMQLLHNDAFYASVRPIFRHPDGTVKALGLDILTSSNSGVAADASLCDLLPPAELPDEIRLAAKTIAKRYFHTLVDA